MDNTNFNVTFEENMVMEQTDYNALENKPQINGVTLEGNKSADELGITVPTKVSELQNDAGYVDEEQLEAGLAPKADTSALTELETAVNAELARKADKTEIPTKVSLLANDAGYQTQAEVEQALSPYAKTQDVSDALDLKADKTEIPTKVSELQNDSDFQTGSEVQTALDPYALKTELVDLLPHESVSGDIVGIPDAYPTKAISVSVPSGAQVVRMGKNLFPQQTISLGKPADRRLTVEFAIPLPAGTYNISWTKTGTATDFGVKINGEGSPQISTSGGVFTTSKRINFIYVYIGQAQYDAGDTLVLSDIMLSLTASAYTPYVEPVTYDPSEVELLLGDNVLYATSGSISVEYYADIGRLIDSGREFIIEGNWRYRIDTQTNTFEAYYTHTGSNYTINIGSGAFYRSNVATLTLPTGITAKHDANPFHANVNVGHASYPAFAVLSSIVTNAVSFYVLSGAERGATATYTTTAHIVGTLTAKA